MSAQHVTKTLSILLLGAVLSLAPESQASDTMTTEDIVQIYTSQMSVAEKIQLLNQHQDFQNNFAQGIHSLTLAELYQTRHDGDPAEHLEQAIRHYQQALSFIAQDAHPKQWAMTHINLAHAYQKRSHGSRAENLERAIQHARKALRVFTRNDFPVDRARTQHHLANVYTDRMRGNRSDNLEQAMAYYQQTLQVFTRDAFPLDWANTHNNLALVYLHRQHDSRDENLEQAIAHTRQALDVFTQDAFPADWAMAQNNLATAYHHRRRGSRADNLEQAIAHYQQALRVFTRAHAPADWAVTKSNLASAYTDRLRGNRADNLARAQAAYADALSALQRPGQRLITGNHYANVLMEAGATDLARQQDQSLLTQLAAEFDHISGTDEVVLTLRARADLYTHIALRALDRQEPELAMQALRRSRSGFLAQAWRQQRLQQQLPEAKQQQAQALRSQIQQASAARSRWTPDPTDDALRSLYLISSAQIRGLTEQLHALYAGLDESTPALPVPPNGAWVVPLWNDRAGAILVVSEQGYISVPAEALAEVMQWSAESMLQDWKDWLADERPRPDQALLDRLAHTLGRALAEPLVAALQQAGVAEGAPVYLVPQGPLAMLPWWLAEAEQRPLWQRYRLASAPALEVPPAGNTAATQGVAAFFNSDAETGLRYIPLESVALNQLDMALERVPADNADTLLQALQGAAVWHVSTHARYDWDQPMRAALQLPGRQKLRVEQLLQHQIARPPQLVVLAACETGLALDQQGSEWIGLPSAFLQAGAQQVLATLWQVDDLSTALLTGQFYQSLLAGASSTQALYEAQQWLRQVTVAELEQWLLQITITELKKSARQQPSASDAQKRAMTDLRIWLIRQTDAQHRPFADPYYWAGFYLTVSAEGATEAIRLAISNRDN